MLALVRVVIPGLVCGICGWQNPANLQRVAYLSYVVCCLLLVLLQEWIAATMLPICITMHLATTPPAL
jgi:hypothetical protein